MVKWLRVRLQWVPTHDSCTHCFSPENGIVFRMSFSRLAEDSIDTHGLESTTDDMHSIFCVGGFTGGPHSIQKCRNIFLFTQQLRRVECGNYKWPRVIGLTKTTHFSLWCIVKKLVNFMNLHQIMVDISIAFRAEWSPAHIHAW